MRRATHASIHEWLNNFTNAQTQFVSKIDLVEKYTEPVCMLFLCAANLVSSDAMGCGKLLFGPPHQGAHKKLGLTLPLLLHSRLQDGWVRLALPGPYTTQHLSQWWATVVNKIHSTYCPCIGRLHQWLSYTVFDSRHIFDDAIVARNVPCG